MRSGPEFNKNNRQESYTSRRKFTRRACWTRCFVCNARQTQDNVLGAALWWRSKFLASFWLGL